MDHASRRLDYLVEEESTIRSNRIVLLVFRCSPQTVSFSSILYSSINISERVVRRKREIKGGELLRDMVHVSDLIGPLVRRHKPAKLESCVGKS
jgi:hypothetical protein